VDSTNIRIILKIKRMKEKIEMKINHFTFTIVACMALPETPSKGQTNFCLHISS
jgi:hypothetical protein